MHGLRQSSAGVSLLIVGGLIGALFTGGLSHEPVNAVATDRQENFAICTGPLDEDVEGVYVLDSVTGMLKCYALSIQTGKFNAYFERNIQSDFGIEPGKNPKYLMVTGISRLVFRSSPLRPSLASVYVTELSTGKMVAYSTPWTGRNSPNLSGALQPLDSVSFRTAAVRPE